MSKLDEIYAALVELTGEQKSTLDELARFLRSRNYTQGSLLDALQRYSLDISSNTIKILHGIDTIVDVNPPEIPSAPVITGVERSGSGVVAISYTPSEANGAAITGYTATSTPGGIVAVGLSNPLLVPGLTNGTSYTFVMKATNSVGDSLDSAASSAIVPATVPNAPSVSTVSRTGVGQVSVPFSSNGTGGSAITGYEVVVSPGGAVHSAASSPKTISGLTPTQAYTFAVRAINAVGTSALSGDSNSITPYTVPDAPTIGVATIATDTSASVTFSAPASNGGSPLTGYKVVSSPGANEATGATSPIVVTGLLPDVTYTFVAYAVNAAGDSVASAASNAITMPTDIVNPGPFDSLYAGDWVPYEGTSVESPAALSIPSKSTGIASPSYTDADYGTKIFRVANVTDSPGNGTTKMRHEYARRCPFNCDSTKYILQNASGFMFVYDAETFECLDGGVTTSDVKERAVGTNSLHPKDPRDWTWHPTDPNKIIFFPQTDGLTAYEFDVVTHAITTKFSLSGRLAAHGMGTADRVRSHEGRPSDDARYWGWQVLNGTTVLGYLTYDMDTDTITGSLATSNGANNVTMSPTGDYILISASGAGLTYEECEASATIRGTRAYTRDFSSFKQVHVTTTHMDVGYDYLGNEVMVSLNPGSSTWNDGIVDNSLFYITLADAAGPVQLIALGSAMSQWNSHYSGTCAPDRPGWCTFSAYDETNRSGFPRYLDNNIALVELKPAGKVYRLADHRTTRYTYWQEPHATMSRDGLRIMYSCSWDNTSSSNAALSYMIGLPSWIYGEVAPPGGPLLDLTFDDATGWALGTACTVTGGKLHCNNTAGNSTNIYATTVLPAGTYDIEYTISDFNSGNVTMRINSSGTIVSGTTRLFGTHSAGTYTDRVTIAAPSTEFQIRATRSGTSMDFKVDDITITEVPA